MTTVFSSLTASITALTELVSLVSDVALLCLGVTAAAKLLEALERIIRAWLWLAGLVQLLFQLLCTAIAEYAPVAGRHLGRAAGTTVRLGRQARCWYERHAAPTVTALDYTARTAIAAQLGTSYPQLQQAIAPAQVLSLCIAPVESEPVAQQQLTRRDLLALARERHLPRYSRLSTDALREALAA
jgi:hypothetical protein